MDGGPCPPTHDVPHQVILGVFGSADRADAVRTTLRESARRELIEITRLALIKRDAGGSLEVVEARTGRSSLDELPGSLPQMFRLMLGAGNRNSTSRRLCAVAAGLQPDSSAIAALVDHRWIEDVRSLMEEAGSDAVTDALRMEIAHTLASGRDVVFTTGAADWRALPR